MTRGLRPHPYRGTARAQGGWGENLRPGVSGLGCYMLRTNAAWSQCLREGAWSGQALTGVSMSTCLPRDPSERPLCRPQVPPPPPSPLAATIPGVSTDILSERQALLQALSSWARKDLSQRGTGQATLKLGGDGAEAGRMDENQGPHYGLSMCLHVSLTKPLRKHVTPLCRALQ